MTKFITHYDQLQVSPNANSAVIRAAYKALSQKWHPDKHRDNTAQAYQQFHIIKQAYDVLSDPTSRQQYDLWMQNQLSQEYHTGNKSKQLFNYYTVKEKKPSISVKV